MSSLSQESAPINLKKISNNDKEMNITKSIKDKFKMPQKCHPLEFYALGKTNKNQYISSTLYCSSPLSSPCFRTNNSSHNLFERNLLSVNNSNFENLKKVKKMDSLTQLNNNENNYLNPLLTYKIRNEENKECQKKNNINSLEWLNIIKNKLFSIDINSRIKKGKNISKNQFYEQRNKKILTPNNSLEFNNQNNSSYELENKNNLSDGYDYKYNTYGSVENLFSCNRFNKDNEKLNISKKINIKPEKYIDYWKKLKIEKSKSTNALIHKDFKKSDQKVLKSNFWYFDKNYKNILRHKNWWNLNP